MKYSASSCSNSQDVNKKEKMDILLQIFPKTMLGIRSIQNFSLSDPSILFLNELGDGII